MILLFRIIEQDHVEIALCTPGEGGDSFRVVGTCDFAKDASHLLLANVTEGLQRANAGLADCTGIAVRWSATARFTVSRLCGVTANSLASALQVPVMAFEPSVSEEGIIAALQAANREIHPQIDILYSGEPTITVK